MTDPVCVGPYQTVWWPSISRSAGRRLPTRFPAGQPPGVPARYPWPPMRVLLAASGLLAAVGLALTIVGVRQQVAWTGCGPHCPAPSSLPVAAGILLIIGGGFVLAWALVSGHAARVLHPAPGDLEERRRLRRVGVQGRARALVWTDAGTSPTGEPLLDVEMSIELPGHAPYTARHRVAVARRHLGRLRSGRPVPVLVDPADPGRIAVESAPRQRRAGPGPPADPPGPEP